MIGKLLLDLLLFCFGVFVNSLPMYSPPLDVTAALGDIVAAAYALNGSLPVVELFGAITVYMVAWLQITVIKGVVFVYRLIPFV